MIEHDHEQGDEQQPTGLADLVLSQLDDNATETIIRNALAADLTGSDLHQSLVLSGIAHGVERAQAFMLAAITGQAGMLRKTVADLDRKLMESAGDDDAMALISSLKEPLAARLREHLEMVTVARAAEFEEMYGVDRAVVLARKPIDMMDPKVIRDTGSTAAFAQPAAFYGFLRVPNRAEMKCGCPQCLTMAHLRTPMSTENTLKIARTTFGSVEQAFDAFGSHIIEFHWKLVDSFEEEYGNLETGSSEAASSAASEVLAKYSGLGGTGKSH